MKTRLIILACILMAFSTPDVLKQLGVDAEAANNYMFNKLSFNNVQFDKEVVDKARSLPVDVRVGCTKLLVRLLREYTESETFAKAYKKYRSEQMRGKSHGFHIPKPSELLDKAKEKLLNGSSTEALLPASPKELVKMRLQEFLKISATVDFNAQLNGSVFADAACEAKSNEWKMYYRAGKPVIDAACEEVRAWLAQM